VPEQRARIIAMGHLERAPSVTHALVVLNGGRARVRLHKRRALSLYGRAWQLRRMRRAVAAAISALFLGSAFVACADNPYWIGRYPATDDRAACGLAQDSTLVCTSFEQGELDGGALQAAIENEATIEVSDERSHGGERSLRAESLAAMSAAVFSSRFAPVRQGELHLRAYLYVAGDLSTEIMNILFLGASAEDAEFDGIDINLQDGSLQVFSPQAGGSLRRTSTRVIPRDRWFCLRMRLTLGDETGALELFSDDELALSVAPLDTLPAAGVSELRAGIDWSSAQSERFEIFIDDLVLAAQPVGCDPP
jgi:hypothetical protein